MVRLLLVIGLILSATPNAGAITLRETSALMSRGFRATLQTLKNTFYHSRNDLFAPQGNNDPLRSRLEHKVANEVVVTRPTHEFKEWPDEIFFEFPHLINLRLETVTTRIYSTLRPPIEWSESHILQRQLFAMRLATYFRLNLNGDAEGAELYIPYLQRSTIGYLSAISTETKDEMLLEVTDQEVREVIGETLNAFGDLNETQREVVVAGMAQFFESLAMRSPLIKEVWFNRIQVSFRTMALFGKGTIVAAFSHVALFLIVGGIPDIALYLIWQKDIWTPVREVFSYPFSHPSILAAEGGLLTLWRIRAPMLWEGGTKTEAFRKSCVEFLINKGWIQ